MTIPELAATPGLQALLLLEWLQEQYLGQYLDSLLRLVKS